MRENLSTLRPQRLAGNPGNRIDRQRPQCPIRGKTRIEPKRAGVATPADLSRAELERAISEGYCWWCGATHGTAGKQITGWSMHWSKAHGISAQDVRDILGCTKQRVFVSEPTREKMRANYRRRDPRDIERARKVSSQKRKGRKCSITKGGSAALSANMKRRSLRLWGTDRELMMEAAAKSAASRMSKTPRMRCRICGGKTNVPVTATAGQTRTTCSDECKQALHVKVRVKLTPRKLRWARKARAAGMPSERAARHLGVTRRAFHYRLGPWSERGRAA